MDCLDCKICHVAYDEEDHRPRNSSCGHELCTACVKALINNGTFMCPTCRKTSEVNDPDDLPVSFGLIDVIRAFKTPNMSLTKESEVCYDHLKVITHRCLKCNKWTCDECMDNPEYSSLIKHRGCNDTFYDNIMSASDAMKSMKDRHTKDMSNLLTCFTEQVNYAPSLIKKLKDKIQERTNMGEVIIEKAEKQKKEILDRAEKLSKEIMEKAEIDKEELLERTKKHDEDIEEVESLIEQGNNHKDKLAEWDNHLQSTSSPYRMMDNTEMLTQNKQLMKSTLESLEAYTLIPIIKDVKKNKEVYLEMVIGGEKKHGKLSQIEENIYFHYVRTQNVSDSSISIPFARLHMAIHEASLVFFELSIGGVVKGRVIWRLSKDSPNFRENMVEIVTGKSGTSKLAGIRLWYTDRDEIRTNNQNLSDIPVTPDRRICYTLNKCNVVGFVAGSHLCILYFQFIPSGYKGTGQNNLGYIESGMDILQECRDVLKECPDRQTTLTLRQCCLKSCCDVEITDSGLVLEELKSYA